ncbi:HAD family hydrolase [Spirosoma lituiforme]
MASIIFDLDQTLVDSSSAEGHRQARQWPRVYDLIPKFTIYSGLADLFQHIQEQKLKVCIVTTSPESYCHKVLAYWSIPFHHTVCYHDVRNRKPHPESILKAVSLLNDDAANILSLGDRAIDIQASKAANIRSVGCLWGTSERSQVLAANPNYLAETPAHALAIIKALG